MLKGTQKIYYRFFRITIMINKTFSISHTEKFLSLRYCSLAFLFIFLICSSYPCYAQRGRRVVKKKVEQEDFSRWTNNPICKTIIVDSIVVNENELLNHLTIPSYMGKLYFNEKVGAVVYENDFGDMRLYSSKDSNGESFIYRQTLLADKWSEPEKVVINGDNFNFSHPIMMPDGMTLYFSSNIKQEDIENEEEGNEKPDNSQALYTTVYDSETNSFLEPQKLPFPFNSDEDDIYYIEDEISHIAWLVTKRRQPKGKVCIYTMSVEKPWTFYDAENTEPKKLKSLALISSISDTWTAESKRKEILKTVEQLKSESGSNTQKMNLSFVVNSKKVYHSVNDFKTEEAKNLFVNYIEQKNRLSALSRQLNEYRRLYHSDNNSKKDELANTILKMEKEHSTLLYSIRHSAKQIRELENR